VDILTRHRQLLEGMRANRFRKLEAISEWVFPNERGGFINYGNFIYRVWNPVMDKSKLRRFTPHDMRHTYATLRLSNGSADITFRTYYKWLPKESKTDIDTLDGKTKPATKRNPPRNQNKKEVEPRWLTPRFYWRRHPDSNRG
jgi:integrase